VRVAKDVAFSSGTRATQTETDWILAMEFDTGLQEPVSYQLFTAGPKGQAAKLTTTGKRL